MEAVPSLVTTLPLPSLQRRPNDSFREHVGFLGLMSIWVACMVYLMVLLQPLLRPLLWAVFLVMGLTPAVTVVERCLNCTSFHLCNGCSCVIKSCLSVPLWICDRHCSKRNCKPCRRLIGAVPPIVPTAKRRKKIPLSPIDELRDIIGASVGDARSGGRYSAPKSSPPSSESEEPDSDHMPVTERSPSVKGSSFFTHTMAILLVVIAVMCAIGCFVLMCIQSVVSLQDHWGAYQKGALNIVVWSQAMAAKVFGRLPEAMANELTTNALQKIEEIISSVVRGIIMNAHSYIFELLMMSVYIFFWLMRPMPVSNSMEELFKRYIVLKFIACLGYGTCVGILLWLLNIDLAAVCGLFAVFMNFIPEVGPIVASLVPIPIIIFDGRLESPFLTLLVAMSAQLALKFLFGNIVEVKLVEADELMKMHPVIILLAIAFFGYIWGPTGMLLAVPLVAMFKVSLLSDSVPKLYRDPLLVMLEGDRQAPANHAKQRRGNGSVQPS